MTKSELETLREFTVAVARAPGIGPVKFRQAMDHLGGINAFYNAWLTNQLPLELQKVINDSYSINIPLQLPANVTYVCMWEEAYSYLLSQIPDAPPVLFCMGNVSLLNQPSVAVVGTRNATAYGKQTTLEAVRGLVEAGITVISGMAFGIDACAHLAAMDAKGSTIAVLPGPVSSPLPVQNTYIYERILANQGLIISEVFPGIEVYAGMFASRNRIVAGLSKATLVIEAPLKSGALITADVAFDYQRDVFAVPGRINDNISSGCNQLIINNKATLYQRLEQMLDIFQLTKHEDQIPTSGMNDQESVIFKTIYNGISKLEDICSAVDRTADDVISLLMVLELSGAIKQDQFGEYFVNKHK